MNLLKKINWNLLKKIGVKCNLFYNIVFILRKKNN